MSSPESDNSDSDAPETVSLKIAKREFTTQRKVDEERQRAEAQIKHQKNQARDAKLKAEKKRKDAVKKPIKESLPMEEVLLENQDSESMRLQDRMEKAMRDAEEDQDLTESEDDVMQDPNEEDATSSADDSEPNPDYLPDHIFTKQPPKRPEHPPEDKRRRRNRKATHRKKVEERMIGSRVIRTLQSALPALSPSSTAKKSLRRQLKGDLKTKGWERRQVAVGSMSTRSGPALRFTRA